MPTAIENDCLYCRHFTEDDDKYPCNTCANGRGFHQAGSPMLWEAEVEAVNHPDHYNQGGIECIDAMVSAFGEDATANFCYLNAFKYLWRSTHKNGMEDIDKAIWYLNKYKELISSGE